MVQVRALSLLSRQEQNDSNEDEKKRRSILMFEIESDPPNLTAANLTQALKSHFNSGTCRSGQAVVEMGRVRCKCYARIAAQLPSVLFFNTGGSQLPPSCCKLSEYCFWYRCFD